MSVLLSVVEKSKEDRKLNETKDGFGVMFLDTNGRYNYLRGFYNDVAETGITNISVSAFHDALENSLVKRNAEHIIRHIDYIVFTLHGGINNELYEYYTYDDGPALKKLNPNLSDDQIFRRYTMDTINKFFLPVPTHKYNDVSQELFKPYFESLYEASGNCEVMRGEISKVAKNYGFLIDSSGNARSVYLKGFAPRGLE